jgi:hypothetical protein
MEGDEMRARWVVSVFLSLLFLSGCLFPTTPEDPTLFTEQLFTGSTIPGWWTGTDGGKKAWHADSAYHVALTTTQTTYWTTYTVPGRIGNFRLDIDVAQIDGPDDNGFGVVFRKYCYDNYYYFLISGDGYMTFRKVIDGQSTDIQSWTPCAAVIQGNATNHLTIIADASRFTFSVNGTEVLQTTDSTLATGYLGVMVKSYNESGVHVAFDNLVVHWLGTPPLDMEVVLDTFSQGSDHWNATDNADRRTWFADGEYHMQVKSGGIGAAIESYAGTPSQFSNFTMIFKVRVAAGSAENPYGVMFRSGTVGGQAAYYRFLMCDDGRVRLDKRVGGITTALVDWTDCGWIVTGDSHLVQVKADCKQIRVFVDEQLAVSIVDGSFDAGGIWLIALGLQAPPEFHVAFDNVTLLYYPDS